MSHVISSTERFLDLECLKRTLKKHFPQLQWKEGQKTWAWYGKWMNDYAAKDAAYKLGIKPEDYGKCDHAIKLPGCQYEIGIMKAPDGKGWSPVWDFFGQGAKLSAVIGQNAEKLMAAYNQEFVTQFAEQEGMELTTETDSEGKLVLTMST